MLIISLSLKAKASEKARSCRYAYYIVIVEGKSVRKGSKLPVCLLYRYRWRQKRPKSLKAAGMLIISLSLKAKASEKARSCRYAYYIVIVEGKSVRGSLLWLAAEEILVRSVHEVLANGLADALRGVSHVWIPHIASLCAHEHADIKVSEHCPYVPLVYENLVFFLFFRKWIRVEVQSHLSFARFFCLMQDSWKFYDTNLYVRCLIVVGLGVVLWINRDNIATEKVALWLVENRGLSEYKPRSWFITF